MFDRDALLASLGATITAAIQRPDTLHPIFHGCYDWHSAVHGHWALLRLARVLDRSDLVATATTKLTADRLADEQADLAARPEFEMPYGRAWFLRLAIEHAQVTGTALLRPFADELARSLVARYETIVPRPNTHEYDNASWALAQLAAYARAFDDAAIAARVQRHVEAHFLDAGEVPDFSVDQQRLEFFSHRAGWLYLVATTQPEATLKRILRDAALDERTLRPITTVGYRAHSFGTNWSRAWALHRLALVAPMQRELFRAAFDEHVRVGLIEHANDRGNQDYLMYGHWVPQFAVYALTEDAS